MFLFEDWGEEGLGKALEPGHLDSENRLWSEQYSPVMAIPETQTAGDIYASTSSDHRRDMKDGQRVAVMPFNGSRFL